MLVRIEDGQIAEYPYDLFLLRLANPHVSFPEDPDDETLAEFGAYRVEPVDMPEASPLQRIVELEPELVDGTWRQRWRVNNLSAEAAAEVQALLDEDMRAQVVVERTRRLAAGFDYDFGGARGVHRIGTTEQDMAGWNEVNTIASAAVALGQGATPILIVTDTGPVEVTALEWQSVLLAGAAVRQAIWSASFALQANLPLPENYEDDSHWG